MRSFGGIQSGAKDPSNLSAAAESARTAGQQTEETRQESSKGLDSWLPFLSNSGGYKPDDFVNNVARKISSAKRTINDWLADFFATLTSAEEMELDY